MKYEELVKLVEESKIELTRFDLVGLLIAQNGQVTAEDWRNIYMLYLNDVIWR